MFLKPFRIKTQTAIKGSERKRLRADFSKQYACLAEDDLKNLIPNKDDMLVSKIMTHSGQQVVVYSVNGNPVLFEIDSVLYPTVYALWRYPDLVFFKFTTWPAVVQKLQGGADLMLPGVVLSKMEENSRKFPLGDFPKSQGCVVNLVRSRCSMAVGMTALSSEDMMLSGMRGKGVINLHVYKDQLWAMGDKSDPPMGLFEAGRLEDDDEIDYDEDNENTENDKNNTENDAAVVENISDNNDTPASDQTMASNLASSVNNKRKMANCEDLVNSGIVEGVEEVSLDAKRLGGEVEEEEEESSEAAVLNTPELMDDLLDRCFLHALKLYKKKGELPVLTSAFFRNNMVPCCPEGAVLDIKKSSYKKLGKYLTAKQKEGLVKVKELTKGVDSIVEIDYEHDTIRSFKIPEGFVPPPSTEKSKAEAAANFSPPKITEMYLVTTPLLPLLSKTYKKGDPLTASEVKSCITEYVKVNNLQDPNNRGLVHLDPILSDIALQKGENIEIMKWEVLHDRTLGVMTQAYQITTTGAQPVTEIRKGQPEKIKLEVAQRGSNKKVTVVHNLEVYGVDPAEFAALVMKGVACSTSVSEDSSVKKNKNQQQVLVQGNQINYIASLLTDKYLIPAKFITGLQLAPKKKK